MSLRVISYSCSPLAFILCLFLLTPQSAFAGCEGHAHGGQTYKCMDVDDCGTGEFCAAGFTSCYCKKSKYQSVPYEGLLGYNTREESEDNAEIEPNTDPIRWLP